MYQNVFDNLMISYSGQIDKVNELIESVALDPERFVIEGKEWINKKAIYLRMCPDCLTTLKFVGKLSVEHIVTMVCPECGRELNYFGYGD